MKLNWVKCKGNVWCQLNTVDLTHSHFDNMEGVYVIWHLGDSPATVRVGQGIIRDRIQAHRGDTQVQAYNRFDLVVAWASVPDRYRNGVEVYLAQTLQPVVGTYFPVAQPIKVNLPWE